jgi:hypothetical protein
LSFFPHEGPGFVGLQVMHVDVLYHLVVKGLGMVPSLVGVAEDRVQGNVA